MHVHLRSLLATFAAGLALSAFTAAAAGAPLAAAATSDTVSPVADHFPISVAELEARHAAMFAQADADGNGLVSFDEFAAHKPPHGQRRGHPGAGRGMRGPQSGDGATLHSRRGDGAPPPARRELMQAELFDELDSNEDGQISRAEFSSENQHAARAAVRKRHMFARLDLNADGVLSAEEFPPRHLIELDTDGDGQITQEEMRSRRGHGPRGPHKRAG